MWSHNLSDLVGFVVFYHQIGKQCHAYLAVDWLQYPGHKVFISALRNFISQPFLQALNVNRTDVAFAFAWTDQLISLIIFKANLARLFDVFFCFKDFFPKSSQIIIVGPLTVQAIMFGLANFKNL